ncbi:AAA family ATPase [Prevotella copri]|uniref:AAA family ATPase n=1 Tax=Segatella copri TaxID=165179 RepID=A0AAW5IDX9_9BACT|nr:AAA family ATPase [Segatella copri]MCP9533179.1 AAA family ATPase [Segatella copri]MCP9536127.1 AAA family ATPase [Segatella copri]MCP9539032.1 AAA family ATPase [Segatella copri]MCP9557419.1 AAA family ATPase [Segatella copri]MCP9560175.1 AAA family ATPase [Segatella copri]
MIIDELKYKILQQFGFPPTQEQAHALEVFAEFLTDRDPHAVMILRGSAGTGKTTLSGAIVRTLKEIRQKVMLLAPTGRAAKVFSLNSGSPAYTIHRRIYREKSFSGVEGQFNLNDNLYTDTLFMVDEASMIANMGLGGMSFGSGCLLDDLVHFVYQGRNDRLLLIGDKAQLPPVGEEESPALHAAMLEGYGLKVYECDLNEVLRQSEESGILYNATMIRQMITHDDITQLPKIHFAGYSDIKPMPGAELIEALADSYHHVGLDDTIVVTRSNKRANIFNQGIRNMVLDREEELSQGDILMIVKNNYYWMEEERKKIKEKEIEELRVKSEGTEPGTATHKVQSLKFQVPSNDMPAFLANGDRAKVLKVRRRIDLYGFRFATLLLQFPDYGNYELEATVLLDTLTSEAPALTHEQQEQLFHQIEEDYQDIPLKADRMKAIRQDQFFNALQVKFAYAVTCHKAQGGQWAHVYVDQGYMTDDMLNPDYIHWLYTAFTRATEMLYLVNWPETQTALE